MFNYYNNNMGMPQTPNYQQNTTQQYNYNLKPMGIPYASEEEIRAYILTPGAQLFAIDRDKPVFYVKVADSLGRSTIDIFEFKKLDKTTKPTEEYVTKLEFEKFMQQYKDLEQTLLKLSKEGSADVRQVPTESEANTLS